MEALDDHRRVIDQSPGRVAEPSPEIIGVAVPKRFVRRTPFPDAGEPLALGSRRSDVHIGEADHSDVIELDDGYGHPG